MYSWNGRAGVCTLECGLWSTKWRAFSITINRTTFASKAPGNVLRDVETPAVQVTKVENLEELKKWTEKIVVERLFKRVDVSPRTLSQSWRESSWKPSSKRIQMNGKWEKGALCERDLQLKSTSGSSSLPQLTVSGNEPPELRDLFCWNWDFGTSYERY